MSETGPVEKRWLWRRIITFTVMIPAEVGIGAIIYHLVDPQALKWIALALVGLIALAHTVHLTGATVSEWAKFAAAARSGTEQPSPPSNEGAGS